MGTLIIASDCLRSGGYAECIKEAVLLWAGNSPEERRTINRHHPALDSQGLGAPASKGDSGEVLIASTALS